jgi:lysophospholipase L1-like esterase
VAIGDSITQGVGDDIPADGTGFESILGDLLATSRQYPNTVANEGIGGDDSADGLLPTRLPTILTRHPDAKYYLILYGTNDANPFVSTPSGLGMNPAPAGSYKANLQQMINLIKNSNKTPYLAKVPFTLDAARIAKILEYNQVIDELVAANGISAPPPDYYGWFQAHQDELADSLHPDGVGYQSMAALWRNVLFP